MQAPLIDMWRSMTLTARAATVFLVVPLVVIIWSIAPIVSTLAMLIVPIEGNGTGSNGTDLSLADSEEWDQAIAEYDDHLDAYRNLIASRSAFYLPKKSSPDESGGSGDGPPSMGGSKPPYDGPRLIGLMGNRAYFDQTFGNQHNYLNIGERDGDTQFVRVTGPRVALIRWKRWDYERTVLGELPLSFSSGESAMSSDRSKEPDRPRSREVEDGEFLFGEPSKGSGFLIDDDIGLERGGQLFIPIEKKDSESDSSESK